MIHQLEMISLEELVDSQHIYRKFNDIVDFDKLSKRHLSSLLNNSNYKGYGVDVLFRALLLQFIEDLSDRELSRFLSEHTSAKWFCKFTL